MTRPLDVWRRSIYKSTMTNALANLSVQQLQRALDIKQQIIVLEQELARIQTGGRSIARPAAPAAKKSMSAAARAKISEAQKARWAGRRQAKAAAAKRVSVVRKSGMSEERRAKLRAAAKSFWARKRAEKAATIAATSLAASKKSLPPAKD
jgi:hypothetical protein